MTPRQWFARVALCAATALGGCAHVPTAGLPAAPPTATWVALGEVHDNADVHAHRVQVLTRWVEAGWRPALVFEQFDTDQQAALDAARMAHPHDAAALVAAVPGGKGWTWSYYLPLVELALRFDLPIVAGNLSRAQAARVGRGDWTAMGSLRAAGARLLFDTLDPAVLANHQTSIDKGHCGALPAAAIEAMTRAQVARDLTMANAMLAARDGVPARPVVLIAGNGHVRRDLGVPVWLGRLAPQTSVLAVGFVETSGAEGVFDAALQHPPAPREDPCLAFSLPADRKK